MGAVDDYVRTLDEPSRSLVGSMYDLARRRVPDALQGVGYGMAALRYKDKPLLAIQATAKHIGLYPFSPAVISAVADRLGGYSLSKGTIRVTVEHPLPPGVLEDIIDRRVAEIDGA
jgi:uncharacterized protein YdhG (YjbR/CyaY superfamily)